MSDHASIGESERAVESGRYRPNVWRPYAFEDLAVAQDDMEHNRAAGKLVVVT